MENDTSIPFSGNIRIRSGLTGRPFQLAACQQMHVQMGNSFPGVMPIVDDQAEASFIQMKIPGNPPDCQHHVPQKGGIFLPGLGKAGNGLARNKQQMFRCLWTNVPEANTQFILIYDVRGDFSRTDFSNNVAAIKSKRNLQ